MKAYTAVLAILVVVVTAILVNRSVVETKILRVPGYTYKKVDSRILNLYNYTLINKSHEEMDLSFKLISHDGEIVVVGKEDGVVHVGNQDLSEGTMMIYLDTEDTDSRKTKIEIAVNQGDKTIETIDITFSSPIK